jgi:hypothetical protein
MHEKNEKQETGTIGKTIIKKGLETKGNIDLSL